MSTVGGIPALSQTFTIIASGTLSTPEFFVQGTSGSSINLALGLTDRPLVLGFIEDSFSGEAIPTPYIHWDDGTGQIAVSYTLWATQSGSTTTISAATKAQTGAPEVLYRYFVLNADTSDIDDG